MKKLIYFLIPLFFLIPKVDGATIDSFNFLGKELDDSWTMASDSSITGQISFINSVDNVSTSTGNFVYVDICTTGYEPTLWITSNPQGQLSPSTKWYKVNTACYVNGYSADVYRQIIFIANSEYQGQCSIAGGTSLSCSSNISTGRLFSNTDYTTYMRLLHFGITEDIPLNDLMFDNQTTQTSILNDILNSIRSDSSINQQIKDNTQKQLEEQKKQLEEQKKTNDILNDDTIDDSNTTGSLKDLSENLPTNSVISDLLLLPVRLFQNIVNSINGTCSPFNLGSLYGSNLTLPCINIESLIGSTLWSVIDILFCGAFILVIRKKFVDIFHNLTDLRNGGNSVE